MTRTLCLIVALAVGGRAFVGEKAPATAAPEAGKAPAAPAPGAPDMSKVGPLSRPVTKPDKEGVDELYKAFEDALMKGDVAAAADLVDFPVIMLSDDSKGAAKTFRASREQWMAMFAPFAQNLSKDAKMTSKHAPTFLSDTLAVSIETNGITMGKTKGKWNAMSVLALVDGKWKFKEMAEAGWGDMPAPAAAKPSAPAPAGKPAAAAPATAKK